ncbi:MAG: hypothetical protein ACR2QW_13790 [bacterium]
MEIELLILSGFAVLVIIFLFFNTGGDMRRGIIRGLVSRLDRIILVFIVLIFLTTAYLALAS